MRNIYQQRVPDVRFLIPVLNGLGKKEVLSVLPKLIKLNPDVVKKVFSRLLGTQVRFLPYYGLVRKCKHFLKFDAIGRYFGSLPQSIISDGAFNCSP